MIFMATNNSQQEQKQKQSATGVFQYPISVNVGQYTAFGLNPHKINIKNMEENNFVESTTAESIRYIAEEFDSTKKII